MNRKNMIKSKNREMRNESGNVSHDIPAKSRIKQFIERTVLPLLLMLFTPNLVMILWYTAAKFDGSITHCLHHLLKDSLLTGLLNIWTEVSIGSSFALIIIFAYSLWAIITMKILPGNLVKGSITPKGNVPIYIDNGFLYFSLTIVVLVCSEIILNKYDISVSIIYDRFGDILGTLNLVSFVFCLLLYVKGLTFPSSSDSGTSGNVVFDYYWGTELYPKIYGIDIKQFTNCRFGMMSWALIVVIFSIKNYQLNGWVDSNIVSTALQLLYITKFFWWEAGYLNTIDIMLDRAGYYICWGCLVFVPGFYTSVSMYLVNHPVHLGTLASILIFITGTAALLINYFADKQKQKVRATNGNCLVWGKKPVIIRATYTLETGEEKKGILLVSGWWSWSRHFHYIPEIILAFCWTIPACFSSITPFFYVIHLLILLTHRSFRDDDKCGRKYGEFWKEYCRKVPYRIIPYLF
ncbi:7-dehydrocholesterol reductase [Octopus vulgaris]|uniref:7-dehydrocholesterol reductase n=1 Tax=Octopus vulgaris TaxID=6645 RepID=A0AA36BCL6_OCTVU|nr:7-dehydrocholesterol reductase [Octopus vulgaris]